MSARVIVIHADAPAKPAVGQACNGCGVCCMAEPCPLGMLLSLKLHGPCGQLRWSAASSRYVCGAVTDRPGPWAALARRWIAAGRGCDSDAEVASA